jgi:hypothetical protein
MIFMPPPANITGRELTRVPTGNPPLGARAVLDDLGAVLVTHHDVDVLVIGRPSAVVVRAHLGVVHVVQIRRADPARQRPDQHLPGPGHRIIDRPGLDPSLP